MKPSEAITLAKSAMQADEPVMFWGPPGVGKSEINRQLAYWYATEILGLDADVAPKERLHDLRMLLRNPVHLMGLPHVYKNGDGEYHTTFTRPADLPDANGNVVVLLLEELNLAVSSVQASGYQIVLDRAFGSHAMHERIRVMATGNRKKDRGATHDMPVPLRDRFIHIEVEPDYQDWIKWALHNDIKAEIIAWIRLHPEFLLVMPGDDVHVGSGAVTFDRQANAFPTPRRYAKLSNIMTNANPSGQELQLFESTIGEPIAKQFAGFLRIWRQLPNPAACITNPETAPVPEQVAARWSISVGLIKHVKNEMHLQNAFTYLQRFTDNTGQYEEKEYPIFFAKMIADVDPELQNTNAYNRFIADYSDVVFA